MKNSYLAIIFLLLASPAYADNKEPVGFDDLIIEEKDKATKSDFKDYWNKYFSGSTGFLTAVDTNGSLRQSAFIKARYKQKHKNYFTTVLEAQAEYINIDLIHKNKTKKEDLPEELQFAYQDELKFSYREQDLEFNEAYVDFNLTPSLDLSIGKKKIIWGQFDPYSPVNLVFPVNLAPSEVMFNKATTSVGQNNISLTWFPKDDVSITGYFFPNLTYHDIIKNKKIDNSGTVYTSPITNADGSFDVENKSIIIDVPASKDSPQYAARVMFYPDWGTLGVSYYNGWDTNNIAQFNTLHSFDADGNTLRYFDKRAGLNKQEMYGIEMAIPVNKWEFIFEASTLMTSQRLHYTTHFDSQATAGQQDYTNWIINQNNNKLFVPYRQTILGAGVNWNSDKWKIHTALYHLNKYYEDNDQVGIDLQESALNEKDDLFPVYPLIYVGRYLDDDKKSIVGIAGGIIGPGSGAILHYNNEFNESIKWGISVQTIEYFIDEFLDSEYDVKNYKLESGRSNSIRCDLTYHF